MIHQKIKNLILILLFLVCIYLSSNIWLQLPNFLVSDIKQDKLSFEDITIKTNIWQIIKPYRNIVKYKDNYTILYLDDKYEIWNKSINLIQEQLINIGGQEGISITATLPQQYLKFEFTNNMPVELFTGHMKIKNKEWNNKIAYIKCVIIDLDKKDALYFNNGKDIIKIENKQINTEYISDIVKSMDFNNYHKYSFDEKIDEEKIKIPLPIEQTALNPVFVQSELDIFDTDKINEIAKKYFENNYEYVRKVVQINGSMVYTYKTEKVLKISSEGLLDFYDGSGDIYNEYDVYKSFVTAINFTENFLGFPQDMYLSNAVSIQIDGNYGYQFTFSYNILDSPIFFSRVRKNEALQIEVIGDKIVSYKRFIRNIDQSQKNKMQFINVMSALDVIKKNLEINVEDKQSTELKILKKDMIKEISNVYLGYFDLSRISKEQVLRVVWVVEIKDKSYIFNAITGALIEEW